MTPQYPAFSAALAAVQEKRRARLGEDAYVCAQPTELRALRLAVLLEQRWPGGLVQLGNDWRADEVWLLRGSHAISLPSYYDEPEPQMGPLARVASVHCGEDEGCDKPDLIARYGEWIIDPHPTTYLSIRAAPEPDEVAALVDVLGPWVVDQVEYRVALAECGRWERVGGPEPCLDAFARLAANSRFTIGIRMIALHRNRFWRYEAEHGIGGYVRFWPAAEGGEPQWAWSCSPEGHGGWGRGSTGTFQVIAGDKVERLAKRDRLTREALELARLTERPATVAPARPPAPEHVEGFVQIGLLGMAS